MRPHFGRTRRVAKTGKTWKEPGQERMDALWAGAFAQRGFHVSQFELVELRRIHDTFADIF